MAEINYDAIKTEYMTTDASLASLARKYNLNTSSVSRKAKKDGWATEKATMRIVAHRKVQEKTIGAQVSLADKCLNIINTMVDKVAQATELCDPSDTKTQKEIMSMVKDLNEMGAFELKSAESESYVIRMENCNSEYEV